jgi:hypothetical protein
VRLEGLGQLKNPITSSGIEPATFRLVGQCLNPNKFGLNICTHWYNSTLTLSSNIRSVFLHCFPVVQAECPERPQNAVNNFLADCWVCLAPYFVMSTSLYLRGRTSDVMMRRTLRCNQTCGYCRENVWVGPVIYFFYSVALVRRATAACWRS